MTKTIKKVIFGVWYATQCLCFCRGGCNKLNLCCVTIHTRVQKDTQQIPCTVCENLLGTEVGSGSDLTSFFPFIQTGILYFTLITTSVHTVHCKIWKQQQYGSSVSEVLSRYVTKRQQGWLTARHVQSLQQTGNRLLCILIMRRSGQGLFASVVLHVIKHAPDA